VRKRYAIGGLSVGLALALAIPAFGGDPTASTSGANKIASKALAKKALKQAKKANRKARKAQKALGGMTLHRVDYVREAADPAEETLIIKRGLRVIASCPAGDLTMVGRTNVDDAALQSSAVDNITANTTEDLVDEDDFDSGVDVDLLPSDDDEVNGTTQYFNPNGGVVTFHWTVIDSTTVFPNPECAVTGYATTSAA
jgi:hypothetical protein